MTNRFKQLEEEFNMDSTSDESIGDLEEALKNVKDLEKSFKKMNHFDTHDEEMDELAELAVNAHKELQELGMNVEIRNAGEIFSSSSQMLKIAVDAKNLKVEKKLKLLKLQLDKMKLDKMSKKEDDEGTIDGSIVMDRNALLSQLRDIDDEGK